MANGITYKETKTRIGYILLGFFTFYLLEPIKTIIGPQTNTMQLIIGAAGIIATLYIFQF